MEQEQIGCAKGHVTKITNAQLKILQQIPGVGKKIANDLWELGIKSPQDLINQDPEELYHRLCVHQNAQIDRCMLYVFRCAVYYASNQEHDLELLKWWHWKDQK
jgi:ERCC4-type nuclease